MCGHISSVGTHKLQQVDHPGTKTGVGLTPGCLFQRKVSMPSGVGQMYAVSRACSGQDREGDDVRSQSRTQDAGRQVRYWQVTPEDS